MRSANDLFPIVIVEDRYNGCYSGGKWIAIARGDAICRLVPDVALTRIGYLFNHAGAFGDDSDAMIFWMETPEWIAVGSTPQEAVSNLETGVRPKGFL